CNVLPDAIFGWELKEHQRKPHPYPIKQILDRYNLAVTDALVLDDLKPGMTMAKSCNLDFAAAGWSHKIPEIKQWMEANSDYYFGTVEEFRNFILFNSFWIKCMLKHNPPSSVIELEQPTDIKLGCSRSYATHSFTVFVVDYRFYLLTISL